MSSACILKYWEQGALVLSIQTTAISNPSPLVSGWKDSRMVIRGPRRRRSRLPGVISGASQ